MGSFCNSNTKKTVHNTLQITESVQYNTEYNTIQNVTDSDVFETVPTLISEYLLRTTY